MHILINKKFEYKTLKRRVDMKDKILATSTYGTFKLDSPQKRFTFISWLIIIYTYKK